MRRVKSVVVMGLLGWGPTGDSRVDTTGMVVVLLDGGSCMERRERFEGGKEAARRVIGFSASVGLPVLLGIWWSEGLLPLCMGWRECIEAVDEYAVVGGRGCWDYALLDAARVVIAPADAVVIGCCRGACSRSWSVPRLYRRVAFLCLGGFSERSARRIRERGVGLVTDRLDEVLRFLAWGGGVA